MRHERHDALLRALDALAELYAGDPAVAVLDARLVATETATDRWRAFRKLVVPVFDEPAFLEQLPEPIQALVRDWRAA